jgi:hypothetical protein
MMVPFHLLMFISSPSCNPYEQVPSPIPFSPFSSSSRRRNERGTGRREEGEGTEEMTAMGGDKEEEGSA